MEIVQFELAVEYSSALESECFNEQLQCIDFLRVSMRCLSDVDTSDIVLLKEG